VEINCKTGKKRQNTSSIISLNLPRKRSKRRRGANLGGRERWWGVGGNATTCAML
jgi:hypothetical protein